MVFPKGQLGRFKESDEVTEQIESCSGRDISGKRDKASEPGGEISSLVEGVSPENGRGAGEVRDGEPVAEQAAKDDETQPESQDRTTQVDKKRPSRRNSGRSQGRKGSRGDSFIPKEPDLPGNPLILSRLDHTLSRKEIDPDALKVMRRLIRHGYKAFLVGGAVRDLLLRKAPKDYDLGTDASPEEVRTLFRNSRVIGRRFKIIHVYFRGNKIIEVATFRDAVEHDPDAEIRTLAADNTFGTPETDAVRRDLTINGLFYDLNTFSVIDYVGGVQDLRDGIVRIIGDPEVRIQEDPVRMIRAIRHAARTGFTIEPCTYQAICRFKALIKLCSSARLFEEFIRELREGHSLESLRFFEQCGLLPYLLPVLASAIEEDRERVWPRVEQRLERIDRVAGPDKDISVAVVFLALLVGNLPGKYRCDPSQPSGLDPLIDYWEVSPRETDVDSAQEISAVERLVSKGSRERGVRQVRSKRGNVSKLGKMLAGFFETIGVPRREREKMELLLATRYALIAGGCENFDRSLLQKSYFDDLLLLLQLTADDERSRETVDFLQRTARAELRRKRRGRGRSRTRRRRKPAEK